MQNINEPTKTLIIHFECFDDVEGIPPDSRYVAWLEGDEHRGMVCTGNSISDCMKELATSLKVLELYRANPGKSVKQSKLIIL